ncbi:hypothetical protein GCM10025865_10780 [Paraoerskovia sediminicola]|uniref:DnaJ homologue subfamily C member 28 conserved domain-containing protein n=1 Tax=Paraoerskovia sediminicola TaxID=1138587 RepID=A0ABN6XAB8_9CELL|nr:DUF1992 domain-containing protein [Paraoerskovia sediminicola]BDZ41779.1 hypothetical protein GCM10025865_10780 [Paraoerskovia sediminicola]
MTKDDAARRAAQYRAQTADRSSGVPYDPDDAERQIADFEQAERDKAAEARRARDRVMTRHLWVERQIQAAMERGEFDDLPLAGKPIPGLDSHDPDWWVKKLVEREQISGVAPEAIQLRKDDAALDEALDELLTAQDVRAAVEEFDVRVVAARRQLTGGPPVVTPTRDPDVEVERWLERRQARSLARRAAGSGGAGSTGTGGSGRAGGSGRSVERDGPRRWWRRR